MKKPFETNLLDDKSFHVTMVDPMKKPPVEETEIDIWTYIDAIPEPDFGGFAIGDNDVMKVYRSGDQRYDHVLISTTTKNVILVVVIELVSQSIFGHHILNLNEKYGLETAGDGRQDVASSNEDD